MKAKVNLALNKNCFNQEVADFNAAKQFDSIIDYTKERNQSHRGSNMTLVSEANTKWLKVNLGSRKVINELVIEWELKNTTNYSIEVSLDDMSWGVAHSSNENQRIIPKPLT